MWEDDVLSVLNQGGTEAFLTPPTHTTEPQGTVEGPWRTAFCYVPVTDQQALQEERRTRRVQLWSSQGCPNGP